MSEFELDLGLGLEPQLDLTLKGSIGSFKVGKGNEINSLEVKYLLTTVGLDFSKGNDDKLLRELAPVREIFDFKDLDFDEIMQRDIDDARVSSELIPYVLDSSKSGLIKFFPPIVVVALPLEIDRNKPAPYYDKVTITTDNLKQNGIPNWLVTQSGVVGSEIFRFEQPIMGNQIGQHDLVKFSINTSRCQLVIVDGQHRAMALLALYRNLKNQWEDKSRQAFESYYKEWTPSYIKSFDLDAIQLPMIVCTIPALDEHYNGDFDLKKASRSIFLTLNKNARKVSRSRNLLLDDGDLISSFMRSVLSKIKNDDNNILANSNLQIHNVELDQSGDRIKLQSPVALTGVTHLHYIIEHMLLDSSDINGISKREGRFKTRVMGDYFTNALSRLKCEDVIGTDGYNQIRRDVFSSQDEQHLKKSFDKIYGKVIIDTLKGFYPYQCFVNAAENVRNIAEAHQDVHLKPMLFDGQGIAKIFESHRETLSMRVDDGYFKDDVPRIQELVKQLDSTNRSLEDLKKNFCSLRAVNYVRDAVSKKYLESLPIETINMCNEIYDNIFTSIAFQSALICGFFTEFEKFSNEFTGHNECELSTFFNEYLEAINAFFKVKSITQLKNVIGLFVGEVQGDNLGKIRDSLSTFRNVVYPGEMQPDEWPKYRYLLLEIWKSSNHEFEKQLENERIKCRKQVVISLYNRLKKQFIQERRLLEEELKAEDRDVLVNKTCERYKDMLSYLSKRGAINEDIVKKFLQS